MTDTSRVALITGASRGLGLALAHLLARRGWSLALTARGDAELRAAAAALAPHAPTLALAGDVADPAHAARLVDATLARFGRVDALVNNASTLGPAPMPRLLDLAPADLTEAFRVNVAAALDLARRVVPAMARRGDGVVLNVSSDAAVGAYPGWGAYGATKAALEHVSRVLAAELDATGVRVYVVDPGDMDTRMHRDAEPGVDLSHLPPAEVRAPALAWLLEHERAPYGRFEAAEVLRSRVPRPGAAVASDAREGAAS